MYEGVAASPGIAIGPAWVVPNVALDVPSTRVIDREREIARFQKAVRVARRQICALRNKAGRTLGQDKAAIFDAHLLVLDDPEFNQSVEQMITEEWRNAADATRAAVQQFVKAFKRLEVPYMKERQADIRDVGSRILHILLGVEPRALPELDEPSIVVSHDLTPSDTAQMDKAKVLGFITNIGGPTSHSAIMARTLGIPAVVALKTIVANVKQGDLLIVDGSAGSIIVNPSAAQLRDYRKRQQAWEQEKRALKVLVSKPSVTADHVTLRLAANIGSVEDAALAKANGAEGIGLFRTEFLYIGRRDFPSEEEQFAAYKKVAELFPKHPVVIRTLDIGGDKELSYLQLPEQPNPFLGYRAVRFSLDRPDVFKTQLRAILRASTYGNIKIMYPMITTVEELQEANRMLDEVKASLRAQQTAFNEDIEVGIMIEVPAAAIIADVLARETDFFSIGTNDLIQYTIAVDRMNEQISHLYQPFHPALLRLIEHIIHAAHAQGNWVGMCGEMAADPLALPLLLGLGLDEFSMSAGSVLPMRKQLRRLKQADMRALTANALKKTTAEEVRTYIEREMADRLTVNAVR